MFLLLAVVAVGVRAAAVAVVDEAGGRHVEGLHTKLEPSQPRVSAVCRMKVTSTPKLCVWLAPGR